MTRITSTGLGSGLDIKSLVTGLVSAEGTPATTRLAKQEAKLTTQISSYGNLKSAMSDFQNALSGLSLSSNFQKMSATSSDTATLSVSAFSNADNGSYQIQVNQLAQAQALASKSYASATTVVGTGTLTINFGTTDYTPASGVNPAVYNSFSQNTDKAPLTLTIDSSNNTLVGVRDAINNAKGGVAASIINDGSGSRLVLSPTDAGAKNSLQISVAETGAAGLSDLAFDSSTSKMTQNLAAQDALVSINGLAVTSSSNTISDALKGVTLNLQQQTQLGKTITVNVASDNTAISTTLETVVDKYNAFIATVNTLGSYDAKTKNAGTLLGDSVLQSSINQIRSALTNSIEGLTSSPRTLSDVGVSMQKDGTLKFDSTKFNNTITANKEGVTALFAPLGRPSNSAVQYLSYSTDTKAGQYDVNITQAATQGSMNGGDLSSLLVDSSNDTFKVRVDGVDSGDIKLTQQTYASGADLAVEVGRRINADSTLKAQGATVAVTYDSVNNRLVMSSKTYGTSSQMEITANTSTTLGLNVGTGVAGLDVAGTIGGQAATGKGQQLTSTAGDPQGLKLIISDDTIGAKGTVTFSRGLMDRVNKVMTGLLSTTGSINNRTNGLQKGLDNIAKQRTQLADRLSKFETAMYTRFNAMDAYLGQMQSTASFLTKQFFSTKSTN